MERLGNKLGCKKNDGENFPAVQLPHDVIARGADDYILCSRVFSFLAVHVWGHSACAREVI